MSDIRQARKELETRILDGAGKATASDRRAAFANRDLPAQLSTLVDKVARRADEVTEQDVTQVRAAGFSEDQIFELVVCAAVGQATRLYETALAALDAAHREA